MRVPNQQRFFWPALTCALIGVLALLASLQYRWSNEVSAATSARMTAELASSMMGFRRDFSRELATLTFPFREGDRGGVGDRGTVVAQQATEMLRTAPHAKLVRRVFLTERKGDAAIRLTELVDGKATFVETSWPAELMQLRDALPNVGGRGFHPPPREMERRRYRHPELRGGPPRLAHGGPWFVDASVPALVHPLHGDFGRQGPGSERAWIIIELDRSYIREHLFPELVARYFPEIAGQTYDVEVVFPPSRDEIFQSGTRLAEQTADATLALFTSPGPPREWNSPVPHFRGDMPVHIPSAREEDAGVNAPMLVPEFGPPAQSNWLLLARNRQGSLEAAVARTRTRNLAVSFGVLLVLAATMLMILIASHRARRLAQLQMDFVAGVSHELRTPITVITSAADNIADGVIEDRRQLTRYGEVIRDQAGQLKQLVEQILLFAATQHGKQQLVLAPAAVEEAIDLALNNLAELIQLEGIRVERSIQPALPRVLVNVQALAQCLQNLIANSIKYRGDMPWVGIAAGVHDQGHGADVVITISDRGIGIAAEDLKHIFDPFYRASTVREAQIHGTGLGLSVAKSIVERMGGQISVESRRGAGSSFFVHLPIAAAEVARTSAEHPLVATNDLRTQQ